MDLVDGGVVDRGFGNSCDLAGYLADSVVYFDLIGAGGEHGGNCHQNYEKKEETPHDGRRGRWRMARTKV